MPRKFRFTIDVTVSCTISTRAAKALLRNNYIAPQPKQWDYAPGTMFEELWFRVGAPQLAKDQPMTRENGGKPRRLHRKTASPSEENSDG